jgi:hypothetical protein
MLKNPHPTNYLKGDIALRTKPLRFVLWLRPCLQCAFEFFRPFDISQCPQSDEALAQAHEFRSYDLAASDPHVHRLTICTSL